MRGIVQVQQKRFGVGEFDAFVGRQGFSGFTGVAFTNLTNMIAVVTSDTQQRESAKRDQCGMLIDREGWVNR